MLTVFFGSFSYTGSHERTFEAKTLAQKKSSVAHAYSFGTIKPPTTYKNTTLPGKTCTILSVFFRKQHPLAVTRRQLLAESRNTTTSSKLRWFESWSGWLAKLVQHQICSTPSCLQRGTGGVECWSGWLAKLVQHQTCATLSCLQRGTGGVECWSGWLAKLVQHQTCSTLSCLQRGIGGVESWSDWLAKLVQHQTCSTPSCLQRGTGENWDPRRWGDYTQHYTVTIRLMSTLWWAVMWAILFHL